MVKKPGQGETYYGTSSCVDYVRAPCHINNKRSTGATTNYWTLNKQNTGIGLKKPGQRENLYYCSKH